MRINPELVGLSAVLLTAVFKRMEAFIARRLCSFCLKQGKNNAKNIQRQFSSVRGLSFVRWYPAQTHVSQTIVRQMCTEQKPGEQQPTEQKKPKINVDEKLRQMRQEATPKSSSPITWKNVAIVFTIGGGIVLWIRHQRQKQELERAKKRALILGESALGGDWKLRNTSGKTVSNKDLLGQWLILYFGFTHCPDVCPEELDKVVQAVNMVDANPGIPNLKPVFITVDPDRDNETVMQRYIDDFSPKIMGLTGSKEEIDTACRAYRVYYSLGPKDEDNDYIVDHSIITYLVNPKGQVTDYFGKNKTAKEVAEAVEKRMRLTRKLES